MKPHYCILLSALVFGSSHAQVKTAEVNHYLFSEFTQGIVLLKSGRKDAKLLNYHALTEQLVFDSQGKILAVPEEQLKRIDTVFIKGRRFITLNNKLVEILHHSGWDLYVEHKCAVKEKGKDVGFGGKSETSAVNSPSAVRLGGSVYNMELPDEFETKRYSIYWLKKDGRLKQFVNLKQLRKLYKDKSDLFDDYVNTHDVTYERGEEIVRLIKHLEAN